MGAEERVGLGLGEVEAQRLQGEGPLAGREGAVVLGIDEREGLVDVLAPVWPQGREVPSRLVHVEVGGRGWHGGGWF